MDLAASWDYIEKVTKARLLHNKTARHVSEYGTYIEVIGAAGELAARRYLKMPEELHECFDGGADFYWNGLSVDVKATILTPQVGFRFLQWREGREIKADIIILTAENIERREAALLGWAMPSEIRRAPINATRDYPCHEIPARRLHKPHELLQTNTQERSNSGEGIYGSHQTA